MNKHTRTTWPSREQPPVAGHAPESLAVWRAGAPLALAAPVGLAAHLRACTGRTPPLLRLLHGGQALHGLIRGHFATTLALVGLAALLLGALHS